jgi:hypothetical protein
VAKQRKALPFVVVLIVVIAALCGYAIWWTYLRPPRVIPLETTPPIAENRNAPVNEIEANQRLADWWRQGNVRATGATATIRDAYAEANRVLRAADPEIKEPLQAALEMIDDAGANIVECTANPPDATAIGRDFRKWDEARVKNVSRAERAAMSLREAYGIVSSLAPDHPELLTLKRLTALAREDAVLVVTGFGGQWPPPSTE